MKELCFYRDNSYFNDEDYFLMYDTSLNRLYLNTADCGDKGGAYCSKYIKGLNYEHNIFWHNIGPLEYKLSSIPCINYKELVDLKVVYKGTGLTGKIAEHVILNSLGVHWDKHNSQEYKKWGFPYFWNDPNKLELLP